jgi:biopolymer transport protein ExbB
MKMRFMFGVAACAALYACGLDDTVVEMEGTGSDASGPSGGDASIDASIRDATSDGTTISGDGSIITPDGGPPADGYEKALTIHSAKVMSTLASFPVWIQLVDSDLAAHAIANGSDIYFTDAAGTPLAYEIERWVAAGGHLDAWVKIPSLSNTADTTIIVRYGKSGGPAANSAAVFSGNFVSVWHLEAPTAGSFPDALGAHNGTGVNIAANPTTTAQLGSGAAFDGGTGEITFTNALSGNTASTISLWVSQGATTDNDALVVLGNSTADQSRWLQSVFNPAGTNPTNLAIGFYGDDWSNPESNIDIRGAGFTQLVWVYDGVNSSTLYKNGAFADGPHAASGTVNTQGTNGYLGNAPGPYGTNMGAHATIDEVRIANVARTPQWIGTEYANQNSPTTFYAVGAEQAAP